MPVNPGNTGSILSHRLSRPEHRRRPGMTRVLRLSPLLLLAAALAVPAGFPVNHAPPASAQEDQSATAPAVLVGNFGQDRRLSDWSTNNFVLSQGFTTGNAATTLASIEASIRETLNASHIATVRAELWSAAEGGEPGSKLVDLIVPGTMDKGDVAFAAPANTVLSANTAYHFVLYTTGRVDLRVVATFSEDEDDDGRDGWSISNATYHIAAQTPEGGGWVEVTVSGVMLMRVNGQGPGGL